MYQEIKLKILNLPLRINMLHELRDFKLYTVDLKI